MSEPDDFDFYCEIALKHDTNLLGELFAVARDILKEYPQEILDAKGAKILSNLGKFQDTPHLHIHAAIGDRI